MVELWFLMGIEWEDLSSKRCENEQLLVQCTSFDIAMGDTQLGDTDSLRLIQSHQFDSILVSGHKHFYRKRKKPRDILQQNIFFGEHSRWGLRNAAWLIGESKHLVSSLNEFVDGSSSTLKLLNFCQCFQVKQLYLSFRVAHVQVVLFSQ